MSDQSRNKLSSIRRIGFDLDNTLYPSTPEIQQRIRAKICEKLACALGLDVERVRVLFEENYNGTYSWSKSGSRTISEIARQYDKSIDGSGIVQDSIEEADILDLINPNQKLNEMLTRMSDRYNLDLITGSRRRICIPKLHRLGIRPGIFGLILSDEDGSKTQGDIYRKWLQVTETSASGVLYVGDNLKQDIIAPKKLGITTCLVGDSNGVSDFCIKNILDLEELLKSRN